MKKHCSKHITGNTAPQVPNSFEKNVKTKCIEKVSNFGKGKARIVQLNPFQAELKRMSAVISYSEDEVHKDFRVVVKGAPETIGTLLKEVKGKCSCFSLTNAKDSINL